LKKQGIALSLWEIFTLFEYLNTTVSKQVFYEPQRYHAILFEHFYTLITGKDDYRNDLAERIKEAEKKGKKDAKKINTVKVKNDDALQLAASLNQSTESDPMAFSEEEEDDGYDSSDEEDEVKAADKYR